MMQVVAYVISVPTNLAKLFPILKWGEFFSVLIHCILGLSVAPAPCSQYEVPSGGARNNRARHCPSSSHCRKRLCLSAPQNQLTFGSHNYPWTISDRHFAEQAPFTTRVTLLIAQQMLSVDFTSTCSAALFCRQ